MMVEEMDACISLLGICGLSLFYPKTCQRRRLLVICFGFIIAKTNIHVFDVGYDVPT